MPLVAFAKGKGYVSGMVRISKDMKYVILFIILSILASSIVFVPGWLRPP